MNTVVTDFPPLSAHRAGTAGMVGSSVMFSLMAVLIRYGDSLDSSVLSLARFAVGLVCILIGVGGGLGSLTFVNGKLLILRGLLGGVGVVIFYASIHHMGLAKGTVLTYTYPIFAAVIGVRVLGERLGPRTLWAIAIAFAGLVLTVSGGEDGRWTVGYMEGLALFGALVAGMVVVIIRKLRETDSTSSIFMAQCVAGLVLVAAPAYRDGWDVGVEGWAILAGVGLSAAVGQLLMTHSYKFLPVARGSLLGMLTPVFNLLLGAILFHEAITVPNGIGMVLVLGASLSISS
jgi:drug/metabolite transporter (DMT)-like permease